MAQTLTTTHPNSSTRPNDHLPASQDDAALSETQAQTQEVTQDVDAEQSSGIGGFFEAIFRLIASFFQKLFGDSAEAPNESVSDSQPIDPKAQGALIHKFFNSHAMEKLKNFRAGYNGARINFINPVAGDMSVSSGFGHREAPTKGASSNHLGNDFVAAGNPDIVASADGIVMYSGRFKGYGNVVALGHQDGSTTFYAEMSGAKMPEIGSFVRTGTVIGVMGDTGISTGKHLHYEQHAAGSNKKIAPRIDGVLATKNKKFGSDVELASLVNPNDHSSLPVYALKNGAAPSALAFVSSTAKTSRGTHLS